MNRLAALIAAVLLLAGCAAQRNEPPPCAGLDDSPCAKRVPVNS